MGSISPVTSDLLPTAAGRKQGQLVRDGLDRPAMNPEAERRGKRYFALFGNPVGHSLSPLMHNATLAELSYPGHYLAFAVSDIGAAVSGIRGLNLLGVSVTLPFKTEIMAYLDEIDPCAEAIGAVNTIKNEAGRLTGYNTDWIGVVRSLKEAMDIKGKTFIILGAGGAARAAVYGLIREGGSPIVVSRNREAGRNLADQWGIPSLAFGDLERLDAHVLINTTPVGMAPDVEVSPVSRRIAARFPCVMDMIYNPLETKLLRDAHKARSLVVSGLGMFVHQGAAQFQIWTGIDPPAAFMTRIVEKALRRLKTDR